MLNTKILSTRNFCNSFFRHISLAKRIRIAAPYVGRVPGYGTLADFVRSVLQDDQTSLELITCPPGTANGTISEETADAIVALGVELLIHSTPPLHSKVYQVTFKNDNKAAYVGSANFSRNGLKNNDETMALLLSIDENRQVERELDRLSSGYGTVPYGQWKAFRAAKQSTGKTSKGKR